MLYCWCLSIGLSAFFLTDCSPSAGNSTDGGVQSKPDHHETLITFEAVEKNKRFLKALNNSQVRIVIIIFSNIMFQ